jgi:hypothetical protein
MMGERLSAWNAAWSAAGGVFMLAGITSAPLLWPDVGHSAWRLALAIVATLAIPVGLYWMIAALKQWWPFSADSEADDESCEDGQPPSTEDGQPPSTEDSQPTGTSVIQPVSDEEFQRHIRGNKQT